MSVVIWEEPFSDKLMAEVMPYLEAHYREIAWRQDVIPLDVDVERYRAMWEAGKVVIFVARKEDLTLVGYNVYFVIQHLHYKSTLYAMNDVLYVEPSARGAAIAAKMLRAAEDSLRQRGVKVMGLHIKDVQDWGKLAHHLGYERVESTWSKWIGG